MMAHLIPEAVFEAARLSIRQPDIDVRRGVIQQLAADHGTARSHSAQQCCEFLRGIRITANPEPGPVLRGENRIGQRMLTVESRERVRQLQEQALGKMRRAMAKRESV